ncbi:hypothetical protein ACIRRA_34220 [Nocardia sp. NPDC101769]|uniref:hypothetical protein n=1 Tax=Nocardia sp. NPDC101769 TaxID=3364333 RepID=UPI003828B879
MPVTVLLPHRRYQTQAFAWQRVCESQHSSDSERNPYAALLARRRARIDHGGSAADTTFTARAIRVAAIRKDVPIMVTIAGPAGHLEAILLATGSVPDQVPDYSRTEIWIGTAILLLTLVAVLIAILRRRWTARAIPAARQAAQGTEILGALLSRSVRPESYELSCQDAHISVYVSQCAGRRRNSAPAPR